MEIITRQMILQKIDDCLSRRITLNELTAWADSVEFTEKFEYEEGFENDIAQVLFELATPEINDELNDNTLNEIKSYINK